MDQLLELINQGENSAIEFKSQDVSSDSLAKEFVAFSNSSGGTLLIGILDDGTVGGVDWTFRNWEEWVHNIARDGIIPPINNLAFKSVAIEDKEVIVLEIPKGPHKPYHTHKNQYLIRVGSTNRVASLAELLRLFQQSGMFHFDLTAIPNSDIRDLDSSKIQRYFEKYDIDFNAEENKKLLLINTDSLTESGEMTVAGNLIFGINPQ